MAATPTLPSTEQLEAVRALYEQGRMLSAYRASCAAGPLATWQPLDARLLAGRLANQLGAPRLSNCLFRSAFRAFPDDPEARCYFGYYLSRTWGPYHTWTWMGRQPEPDGEAPPEIRSSWFTLRAGIAGALRDFDTAEQWLGRAVSTEPESAWAKVCQAQNLEYLDRYDDALAAARDALAMRPWYPPAVQATAHLLGLLGRDDEALDLLAEADRRLESASIAAQLFGVQAELRQYDAAARSLERFAELAPMLEKDGRQGLAARRAGVAYHLGDIDAAIRHACESGSEYWKAIADRLADPARRKAPRVVLPVGYVRQHWATCGPATLTAIGRYWSMPADHLQVAEEICYNGTSAYSERKWARQHGWLVREFSVTEESAAALLDRGIPFTFTTIDPCNAHLQAIIGYDGRQGTLYVRDPYFRTMGEALADRLLERYRAYGPRGMALVPATEADRLSGLELPDAALWDELHQLDAALIAHRREDAQRALHRLQATAPDHRLTLEGRRRMAIYDVNPAEQLAAIDRLAALFPDDPKIAFERLALMRDQAPRDERLARCSGLVAKKDSHPVFWQQYAQELRSDARRHEDAIDLLRRAIRRWPTEASHYATLGHIYWDQRRFDDALELYRFAACLNDKDEQLVQTYFTAALWCKATEAVLSMLQDRAERLGRQSSQPATTLANAYLQLDRSLEAIDVVEEAMRKRPDDGSLMLYAADLYARCSTEHLPRVGTLIEAARQKAPRGDWLRSAARLEDASGRPAAALALWRDALLLQPLALDAHRHVARLLEETEGKAAALAHLAAAAERFPHHYPLLQFWTECLRDEPDEVREPVLRRVIQGNPDDAWVRRELGFLLVGRRRLAEAGQEAEIAGRLEPNSPSYFLLLAHLREAEGRVDDAGTALRQAIELSVDNEIALTRLMLLCRTPAERREALSFVKQQLVKQVTFGDGLLTYREVASETLPPEELLADLREALAARPDLWHFWCAIVQQLVAMDRLDEAWVLIQQATQRFPLLPRLWLEQASVCRYRGDPDAELQALETAHRINPRWGIGVRALADALERRGDYRGAREHLERAVARDPLDALTQVALAEALWRASERDAAIARIEQAIQVEPGMENAWTLLRDWCTELKRPERAVAAARALTERRGGEARSWLFLARLLEGPEQSEARLMVLDRAIALSPRCIDAYNQRASALASAGRYDEAHAACRPAVFGEYPPLQLRVRSARIEAERGNLREAMERMAAVLLDEPKDYAGWLTMYGWCYRANEAGWCLQAAEALVRINPQHEVSFGCLGEARLLNGDRSGAIEAYRRAFELNPKYEYAGNTLFDLQLQTYNVDGAAETLAALRAHGEADAVRTREAQLEARRNPLRACVRQLLAWVRSAARARRPPA